MPEHRYTTPNGHGLGWRPDKKDARDHVFSAPAHVVATLPPTFSLRDRVPEVLDQGNLGACTAHAESMGYRLELARLGRPDFRPSRLALYLAERSMEGDTADDTGAYPRDGYKVQLHQGLAPESEWPYDIAKFADKPPAKVFTDAKQHKIAHYQAVPRTLTAMKTALVQGHAFTCGIQVYSSFESAHADKTGDIPLPNVAREPLLGGHDILIVGYDDKTACFEFCNSWGSSWGKGGFGAIPYGYVMAVALSSDRWVAVVAAP